MSSRPRRSASATSSSPSTARAIANFRRSSGSSTCCRSTGGKAPTRGPQARHVRDHAGEAAGLGPLPHQGVRRRPIADAGAGQGILGQAICLSSIGQQQFRRAALRILPRRRRRRSRLSRPTRSTGAPRTAPRNGRRPTISRPCNDKRVLLKEKFPIRSSGRMQGLRLQPAPAEVQGCPGAPRLQLCVRFRGDEQADASTGQYKRISSYFDGIPTAWRPDLPRGPRTGDARDRCATRCRRRFSRSPTSNPVGGNPEAVRDNLREATAAVEGGRLRGARPQAGRSPGPARIHASNCYVPTRATSESCCSTSLRWSGSASPSACAGRYVAV